MPDFWCPHTIETPSKTYNFPIPDVGKINFKNSGGFQYEAQAVRQSLLKGMHLLIYTQKERVHVLKVKQ